MKLKEPNKGLITAKKIVKGHPYQFKAFLVVGDRGIGKSTYGLRVAREVFFQMGYSEEAAWEEALNCCKFRIQEVIKFLKESTLSDNPKPLLMWDDIGIHASGSKYFLNMKMVDKLKATLDTIRTAISGLIMTCPTDKGLLGMITSYDDYKLIVNFHSRGGMYRYVTAYKWKTLPSGKRIIQTQYHDVYNCYIPDKYFKRYMDMRKTALKETLDQLDDSMKKKK